MVVPYHNPNHPNALVLPRPPSSHQVQLPSQFSPTINNIIIIPLTESTQQGWLVVG